MKNISKIVSWLLHPIFLPILFAILLFQGNYYQNNFFNAGAINAIILIVVIFTLAIPSLIFVLSSYFGITGSFEMESRQERFFAITVIGISVWFCWHLLSNYNLPRYYTDYLLILFVSAAFAIVVSFFKKISLHVFGWSTVFFILVWYIVKWHSFSVLIPALTLSLCGLVAWSRLELEKHSANEIYSGFAFGFFPATIMMFI
jgi:hypothetical protein